MLGFRIAGSKNKKRPFDSRLFLFIEFMFYYCLLLGYRIGPVQKISSDNKVTGTSGSGEIRIVKIIGCTIIITKTASADRVIGAAHSIFCAPGTVNRQ
jgi:hypothetical protein